MFDILLENTRSFHFYLCPEGFANRKEINPFSLMLSNPWITMAASNWKFSMFLLFSLGKRSKGCGICSSSGLFFVYVCCSFSFKWSNKGAASWSHLHCTYNNHASFTIGYCGKFAFFPFNQSLGIYDWKVEFWKELWSLVDGQVQHETRSLSLFKLFLVFSY